MKWWVIAGAGVLVVLIIGLRRLEHAEIAASEQSLSTERNPGGSVVSAGDSAIRFADEPSGKGLDSLPMAAAQQTVAPQRVPQSDSETQSSKTCVPAATDVEVTPMVSSTDVPGIESFEGALSPNKEACFAAVQEIRRARWMFDATPTTVVWYAAGRPWYGASVQETLIRELCAGDRPFDPATAPTIELFFVTAEKSTRVLVGPNWASDGTIQSPLSEEQYAHISKTLSGRRVDQVGPGGNTSRPEFDKRMHEKYYNRITAEEQAQRRNDTDRRRAQQGFPLYCGERV